MSDGRVSYAELDGHLRRQWPRAQHEDVRPPDGPLQRLVPDFLVRVIAPSPDDAAYVFVSIGASDVERPGCPRTEFVLLTDRFDDRYVEFVAVLAFYHLTVDHPLHVGRMVAVDEPLPESGGQSTALLSLPYPYGPGLEWCETAAGGVRFLWVLPIYDAERALVEADGREALERRFDRAGFATSDLRRASVC